MKITMNGVTFDGITMDEAKQIIAAASTAITVSPNMAAAAAPRTLAAAKASSWTERIHRAAVRTTNVLNNGVGVAGNWSADTLSTIEVRAVPTIVTFTGYMAAKSATTLTAAGVKMSSFADRCSALRFAIEFAK